MAKKTTTPSPLVPNALAARDALVIQRRVGRGKNTGMVVHKAAASKFEVLIHFSLLVALSSFFVLPFVTKSHQTERNGLALVAWH